jgi:pyrroline-5-carboxylate reductase
LASRIHESGVTVVSIAAGLPWTWLQGQLPHAQVFRMMPNTPVAVGQGIMVWFGDKSCSKELPAIQTLFELGGYALEVDDEDLVDRLTALSGCGPAYVFYWFEAWLQAAQMLGIDDKMSTQLCLQTMRGSLSLLEASSASPKELYQQVMSKGGATEQAIHHFEEHHLQECVQEGILAAYQRSLMLKKNE